MYAFRLLSTLGFFAIIRDVAANSPSPLPSSQPPLDSGQLLSNSNSIQYFCILDGIFTANATIAAKGCNTTQTTLPHWLANLYIGSVQNGTQSFDHNPWDFVVQTIVSLDGDFSNLKLWDLNFASAGLFDKTGNSEGEFDVLGGVDMLNLAHNAPGSPQIEKIEVGGTPGYRASGDQSGYVGNSSYQNAVRVASADLEPTCSSFYQWFHWDNTNNWNWTLSFTNNTANVSIFTSQPVGTLNVGATCQRMLNNSQQGDLGAWPVFRGDAIELWTNGTEPAFHSWNTSQTSSTTSSPKSPSTAVVFSSPPLQAVVIFFLLGQIGSWILL
ncbi:uncharacterized protein BP5553_00064 [Venustampulla echinocandica]|uniref:Uncharacterized protein n=1 Tax=Venustampulla echinocandica TaxID=2656787 RepID=A0A370TX34_9HELO|nr:uncharacterized protein BP5553_00064 [Venustampulla echinocandica]RDL40085.1 hypothetical protein BP5553_00064 [Venustampulla echinocandica]